MARPTVRHEPAPRHVIEQIQRGELVDYDALHEWYSERCPGWLKRAGCAMDVAALLSSLPDPATWAHAQMAGSR